MSLADLIAGKPAPGSVAKIAGIAVAKPEEQNPLDSDSVAKIAGIATPTPEKTQGEWYRQSETAGVATAIFAIPATATLATDATLSAPVARSEAGLHAALAPARILTPYAQNTQNTQNPCPVGNAEPVRAGFEDIEDIEDRPPEITRPSLHAALADAAAGLPVTLAELIEAFGEEGRADWLEGYEPHCHPRFLRAFARAVAERLERERAEAPPPPGPLDGLPLLREDRQFIEARTRHRRDRPALLTEYASRWHEAAAAEPVPHCRANAGRRAANAWLREVTQ